MNLQDARCNNKDRKSLFTSVAHLTWTHKKLFKAMDKIAMGFSPRRSVAKIEKGIFVGPQIREFILISLMIRGFLCV